MCQAFLKFCFDEDQYDDLQNMIKKENKLNEFLSKNYNILDFLTIFDSINMSFLEFFNIMPKIIPRFYTVASSPNYTKNKLEIIISLVEWKSNGALRYGLTSNYYKNVYENFKLNQDKIKTKIIIRESSFKIPKSVNSSLIMICTGTGIAPYISFLQEFAASSELNPLSYQSMLIFGSKNKKFDFIYENELSEFIQKDVLKKMHTAFSRDNDKKYYVQHLIHEIKDEIHEHIVQKNGHIYICGGISMGGEVVSTLENLFTKEFIKRIESENRLIKELWG